MGKWLSLREDYDNLKRRLAKVLAENAELRRCVELYANDDNWEGEENASEYEPAVVWKTRQHGWQPAQECLEKKVKGGDV